MDRNTKIQWRDDLVKDFDKAQAVYLTHYSGMTVEDLTSLRRELRGTNADMQVVKNTIAKKAIDGRPESVVADLLKGQVAVVFAYGDVAAAAKVVSENAKKNDKFKIVGGVMDGRLLDSSAIQTLASLPSKDVLISKIVGSLVAPHRGLLGVMQGVPRAIVSVLNQIKEKKSEAS